MGGNALNFKTRRVSNLEYETLKEEIVSIFKKLYPNAQIKPLNNYRNKQDFGDIDFIVKKENGLRYSFPEIKKALGSKDYNLNSDSWSFDYKDFQVDFNFHESENWESSCFYYEWGDMGNLLGRISHKMGLKFGHKGLSYVVRWKCHPFSEIVLTKSAMEILPFLGLSYERYSQGFDSLEDIYEFVSSSIFFNPDIYLLENRNHHSRTRDRKRPMYTQFLKWCANKEELNHFIFNKDKSYFFNYIESFFPGFKARLQEEEKKISELEKFKEIYNGDIVSSITGFQGEQLGIFMSKFVKDFGGKEKFQKQAVDNGAEWVILTISNFYEKNDRFHHQGN